MEVVFVIRDRIQDRHQRSRSTTARDARSTSTDGRLRLFAGFDDLLSDPEIRVLIHRTTACLSFALPCTTVDAGGGVTAVVRYPTESAGAIPQTPNIPRTDPGGLDMELRSIRTVPYPRPSGSRGGHRGQNIYPRWGRGYDISCLSSDLHDDFATL